MSLIAARAGLDDRLGAEFGAAGFAGDDDAVGGRQGLAGGADVLGVDAGLGAFAEEQIHHFVGDAVADLVGMAFGDDFAGEQIILPSHLRHLQCLPGEDLRRAGRRQAKRRQTSDNRVRFVKPKAGYVR